MSTPDGREPHIVLASMPWALYNRPSIQLGALKAYLESETGCKVTTLHPFLEIAGAVGTSTYAVLADNGWAGEALFAALLFPGQKQQAHNTFRNCLGVKARQLPEFDELLTTLESSCTAWLNRTEWQTLLLAGFSLCFNQLLASLYIAARLREQPDSPPVVFGGSSCSGALGRSLLGHFPQIDYVVDGEGEVPLAGLCGYLSGATPLFPDRVLARERPARLTASPEIADLNSLPPPDYSSYFRELQTFFPDSPFLPVLPMEFSRGCWWNKCTFCNLNLQWCGYRWKNSAKVLAELRHLTASHQCLDYSFTDNALPPGEAGHFFASTAITGADLRFFAEIRGVANAKTLAEYRKGGLDTIQVGIESLSSTLLRKMEKGVTVIDNIAMLKYAAAADIRLEGNLIVDFPGTTPAEIAETLENLDYVLPYTPLSAASFFLGYGSAVARDPDAYGISAITSHHRYRRLFPAGLLKNLLLLISDYRGDRQLQRTLWRPVRERITRWQDFHRQQRSGPCCPLSYRDGGDFLIIRQELPSFPTLRHKLKGWSRAIYLFCNEIRTVSEITRQFPHLKESAILAFIHQLSQKRLMYREEHRILSLAIHQK